MFLSHCGYGGTQEALYTGTPVIGLPILGDQPSNAQIIQDGGLGLQISWDQLTEQLLLDTIEEILRNPR